MPPLQHGTVKWLIKMVLLLLLAALLASGVSAVCEPETCGAGATCDENGGSPLCLCSIGYVYSGSSCVNANECASGTHNCALFGSSCTDNTGSFTCATGWAGTGVECDNIDECASNTHNCHGQATCTDQDGSFAYWLSYSHQYTVAETKCTDHCYTRYFHAAPNTVISVAKDVPAQISCANELCPPWGAAAAEIAGQ